MSDPNTPIEHESTGGIDPAAFSASLFEPSDNSALETDAPAEPSTASSEGSPVPIAAAAQGVTQNEWDAMPKSWRKEMTATWKTTSPDVRKYVHEREGQIRSGISRYATAAQNWEKVTGPFAEILKEYPDADPASILSTLAQNHIQMVRANPNERQAHLRALAKGYGIEFERAASLEQAAQSNGDPFTPQQLEMLNRTFGPVMESARQSQQFVSSQLATAATSEVDKFFSDPKNEFVNEVADDILAFIKKGKAENLSEAYEMAVMRNPEVKARYIASLTSSSVAPTQASKLPNVKSAPTARTTKPGTMDDTIAAVMSKYS